MSVPLDRWERAARDRWLGNAARVHYGRCGGCDRVEDEHGKPLLVARQPYARRFLCLPCFEFGPDESRALGEGAPARVVALPSDTASPTQS